MPRIVATESDWLMVGLQRFSMGGESALKVEAISRTLGCSKSSFYWHFKSRKEFLSRLLAFWARLGTTDLIARLSPEQPVEERFHALLQEVFGENRGHDFLFYLRRLARNNPQAAALLVQTEQTRLDCITALLTEAGMPRAIAAERAEILYHYYLGWYERNRNQPLNPVQRTELINHLITSLSLPAVLHKPS